MYILKESSYLVSTLDSGITGITNVKKSREINKTEQICLRYNVTFNYAWGIFKDSAYLVLYLVHTLGCGIKA